MGYVDIHAHLVAKLDDGAKSNRESVEMLRQAYEAGVTTVIATPHLAKGFKKYDSEEIYKYCRALEKYARKNISEDIRVYPGQEIQFNEKSMEMIRNNQVISLADGQFILVEFEPTVAYNQLYRALREIAMTAYYPVLAHVERYECLRNMEYVEELRQLGVMLQMNYSSIARRSFDRNVRWCRRMLENGYIDVMGTDMHNAEDRGPRMTAALRWMNKHLETEYFNQITEQNALMMIDSGQEKAAESGQKK